MFGEECFSNWGYKITKKIYININDFNLNIVDLIIAIISWNK
jgi:hypothetical protein